MQSLLRDVGQCCKEVAVRSQQPDVWDGYKQGRQEDCGGPGGTPPENFTCSEMCYIPTWQLPSLFRSKSTTYRALASGCAEIT